MPALNLRSTLATQLRILIFRDKHQFFPAGYGIGLATDIQTEDQIQDRELRFPHYENLRNFKKFRLQISIACIINSFY